MKTFKFKAIGQNQLVQMGVLESADQEEARQTLRNNELQIIELKEKLNLKEVFENITITQLKFSVLSVFCYNMAVFIESGVSLVRGIQALNEQTKDRKMKKVLTSVQLEIERGNLLSVALQKNERWFPKILVPMLASGELSGNLEEVLFNMAHYYERENTIREKVKSASLYPVMLGIIGIVLVVFFITFILPSLNDLIAQTGSHAKLPALTEAVIQISYFLRDKFLLLLPLFLLVASGFLYYSRLHPLRTWLDSILLKLPIFGKHIQKLITARFAGTLSLYLKTGIPISSGLRSLEEIVANEVVRGILREASERVLRGESLTNSLKQSGFFEGTVIEMMRVGEEAGNLEEMLQKLSKQYDKKVMQSIDRMVSLIEPVFTLVIGGAVAVLVIAMALPMLNLSNLINGG